ncbi:MAG: DedA family protein [Candidatus Melainabacteria bacterium]
MEALVQWAVHLGEGIIQAVWQFITTVIEAGGYWGIALLMAIESANVPLPSEMILTSAGVLVHQGKLNFHLCALFGAIGCVLGSLPSYALGYYGGRPFLRKYGKWLLMSEHDLESAEQWSNKYGDWAYFLCRMLPVVRTFISLPAGILRARFWVFTVLTFIGSWVWSYGLVYAGVVFGENLEAFKKVWHKFDAVILGIVFILGVLYVWKHVRHLRQPVSSGSSRVE